MREARRCLGEGGCLARTVLTHSQRLCEGYSVRVLATSCGVVRLKRTLLFPLLFPRARGRPQIGAADSAGPRRLEVQRPPVGGDVRGLIPTVAVHHLAQGDRLGPGMSRETPVDVPRWLSDVPRWLRGQVLNRSIFHALAPRLPITATALCWGQSVRNAAFQDLTHSSARDSRQSPWLV